MPKQEETIIQVDLASTTVAPVVDTTGGTSSGGTATVSTAAGQPTYSSGY